MTAAEECPECGGTGYQCADPDGPECDTCGGTE